MNRRSIERGALIGLTGLMGVVATASGIVLATGQAESMFRMDADVLDGTPFGSFLVPGVILTVVVGGSHLAALAGLLRHRRWGPLAAAAAGASLAGWMAGQVLMIGWQGPAWQQPTYLLYGVAVLALTLREVTIELPGVADRLRLPHA